MELQSLIIMGYLLVTMFFFGFFVQLIPRSSGDKWYVLPSFIVMMAVGAAGFPITLLVAAYKNRRRRTDVLFRQ